MRMVQNAKIINFSVPVVNRVNKEFTVHAEASPLSQIWLYVSHPFRKYLGFTASGPASVPF
jgi:hypothetical protein